MVVEKIGLQDVQNCSVKMKLVMVILVKNHANVRTQDVIMKENAAKNVTKIGKVQIVKSANAKMMELVRKINVCAPTNLKENSVKCQSVLTVGLQYKIQLSLAKLTNAIVGTILEAPIVIIVCAKMVGLVKGKIVSAREIGKENSVKNENVKIMELCLRLGNVNVQRCLKENFVKLVDVKMEAVAQIPNANVHQLMKGISVSIKNAKMAKKQSNLDNVSAQKSSTVNFARTACAKMVSVSTINAVVSKISKAISAKYKKKNLMSTHVKVLCSNNVISSKTFFYSNFR
jgi:hypothetical protein